MSEPLLTGGVDQGVVINRALAHAAGYQGAAGVQGCVVVSEILRA